MRVTLSIDDGFDDEPSLPIELRPLAGDTDLGAVSLPDWWKKKLDKIDTSDLIDEQIEEDDRIMKMLEENPKLMLRCRAD